MLLKVPIAADDKEKNPYNNLKTADFEPLTISLSSNLLIFLACFCRSPSQLMEAGAVGAVAGAAAMPMGRAASHMLERHGPAMQKGAAHLMERSRHDISRATSNMAQVWS